MQGKLENEMRLQKTTDELAKTMPDFVMEWYRDLQRANRSTSSCYDYLRKIRKFLEYINTDIKNFDVKDITSLACESYFIACQTKVDNNGMEVYTSQSYRCSLWSAFNNFFNFLVEQNYIEYNYLNDIEYLKHANTNNTPTKRILLTQRDFNKILIAAKNGSNYKQGLLGNRDVLIILLIMSTGINKSAISEIDIEDIDMNEKTLSVVDSKKQTQIYSLNEQVIDYLNKWLTDREQLKNEQSGNALFLKKDGSRLGDDSIYNIVKSCTYRGIGKKLSPHQLRIGFCAILYKKTSDIEFVQKAAGHVSKQTTKKYIKPKTTERKKAATIISNILNL